MRKQDRAELFRTRLTAAMRDAGLTQTELGEKAGTTAQAIAEIESRRRLARPAVMRKVADALGVEIEAIDEFARPAIDPSAEA